MSKYCAEAAHQRQSYDCVPQCRSCEKYDRQKEQGQFKETSNGDGLSNSERLRAEFYAQTNIAPVFGDRSPYMEYIKWLEKKVSK